MKVEVFNLLFVKEINKKLMVHCQDCARKTSAALDGFKVLNQVSMMFFATACRFGTISIDQNLSVVLKKDLFQDYRSSDKNCNGSESVCHIFNEDSQEMIAFFLTELLRVSFMLFRNDGALCNLPI